MEGGQREEDRERRTEGGEAVEGGGQSEQRKEDRGRKTEGGGQREENRGRVWSTANLGSSREYSSHSSTSSCQYGSCSPECVMSCDAIMMVHANRAESVVCRSLPAAKEGRRAQKSQGCE